MQVENTPIEGVVLIKPKIWRDARGYFVETWQKERYMKEAGIKLPFVQDNQSFSARGTLRGLHFQKQHPQGKLVSCPRGRVFDVACDIRRDSPSYGRWFGVELNEDNLWQLWVSPGLAHGFCVLSEAALFQYKCTDYYHPGDEGGFAWNDPFFGVKWPATDVILSDKDRSAPFWER